ncbi:hypothetical protein GCM10022255_107100 [Dactylosporangium darangshiense]|uniref:RNA polymerase sigma-70 region 2 domain-containing protein n=1 Tax=Dactylosporangium darangshiense TaxID=579108 RepID=A0ABP8DUB6_9ACTN
MCVPKRSGRDRSGRAQPGSGTGSRCPFDLHYTALLRQAVRLGADDAENIVAEAYCQLYYRWQWLRGPDAAPAYLPLGGAQPYPDEASPSAGGQKAYRADH